MCDPTRAPRQPGAIEPPGPWESMGRGVTDLYEPVVQAWYNMGDDQQKAAVYRALRAENERLYQRGLAAGVPQNTPKDSGPSWLPPQLDPTSEWFLTPRWDQVPAIANLHPPKNPPPNAQPPAPSDPWREIGKYGPLGAATLPFFPASALALTPETLMGAGLTTSTYQALRALAQKSGIAE